QHNWQNYFVYTRCGWRSEAGYNGRTNGCSDTYHLLPSLPNPTLVGDYDPCNRSDLPNCNSYLSEMPVTVDYQGVTYQLMDRPYSAGGRCGSPQCLCLVSGVISPIVIDLRKEGIQYTEFGRHVV